MGQPLIVREPWSVVLAKDDLASFGDVDWDVLQLVCFGSGQSWGGGVSGKLAAVTRDRSPRLLFALSRTHSRIPTPPTPQPRRQAYSECIKAVYSELQS